MIETRGVEIAAVAYRTGGPLREAATAAARAAAEGRKSAGVVAATFSDPLRFPSLAVSIAGELGLPKDAPAFDIQMACSAYPYAVYAASKLASDLGGEVLVVDGDSHSPLVDPSDPATRGVFADAATATVVRTRDSFASRFSFMSSASGALECPAAGPLKMDGFKVFSFVATEVSAFLREFGTSFDMFAPHQANAYMVRQLAKSLSLEDKLLAFDEGMKNPGSCSVPMVLAMKGRPGDALIAGFGAGFSASAATVRLSEGFAGKRV